MGLTGSQEAVEEKDLGVSLYSNSWQRVSTEWCEVKFPVCAICCQSEQSEREGQVNSPWDHPVAKHMGSTWLNLGLELLSFLYLDLRMTCFPTWPASCLQNLNTGGSRVFWFPLVSGSLTCISDLSGDLTALYSFYYVIPYWKVRLWCLRTTHNRLSVWCRQWRQQQHRSPDFSRMARISRR